MAIRIQIILFLTVVVAGFCFVVVGLVSVQGRSRFASVGWAQIADGRLSKKVDDAVVASLPENEQLDGLQAGIEYRIFDDAGPQVRAGCLGWLFLAEEVSEVRNGGENMLLHLAIARKLIADFERRHIGIVMLVVPDKARMASSMLCGQHVSLQSRMRLAEWGKLAKTLTISEVDVVDNWPGKPGYWRTDTHWDRGGASFAAQRTASAVRASLHDGRQRANVKRWTHSLERRGDLMQLANLENAPRWLRPPPDIELGEDVSWLHSGGLLDIGPLADVVLTGSSYSRNSGFIDYLGLALGGEVAQFSADGSGFDGALLALLRNHPKTIAQAKVVVWEFPERSLTQPLSDEERAFLAIR